MPEVIFIWIKNQEIYINEAIIIILRKYRLKSNKLKINHIVRNNATNIHISQEECDITFFMIDVMCSVQTYLIE